MYMGVILLVWKAIMFYYGAPHVYGGDPNWPEIKRDITGVLPMYMGVIPKRHASVIIDDGAPHVYGGDPY